MMDTEEYIGLFFPFRKPDFRKKGLESVWNTNDRMMIALVMTYSIEPQAMVMSFMRDYGEQYAWLASVFRDWAFTLVTATLYYADKDRLDETTLDLYRKGMAAFEGMTDEKNPLKICRQCQRPFIAGKADAEFCSPSCREQHRKNKGKK